MPEYPLVNFIGNKEKLASWIGQYIPQSVHTVFDAFSGGCSFSYYLKQCGLQVFSNDILKINYCLAKALIENIDARLGPQDIKHILRGKPLQGFMYKHFANVYYFEQECQELDRYHQNILSLSSPFKRALAFSVMRRAMIRKMPYSRFNIPWTKVVQLRDEDFSYKHYKRRRAYHNQSFEYHFLKEVEAYNSAVFDNGQKNKAYNLDIFSAIEKVQADLIYLDPPYAGTMSDYFGFYGMLDSWVLSKEGKPFRNNFADRKNTLVLLDKLFERSTKYKHLLLSYNNISFPSKQGIFDLLKLYFKEVSVEEKTHIYRVTGSQNKKRNKEYLFIAKN